MTGGAVVNADAIARPEDEYPHPLPSKDDPRPWKDTWWFSFHDGAAGLTGVLHLTLSANRPPGFRLAAALGWGSRRFLRTWYTTPTVSYADYTALSQLPKVKLNVTSRNERKGHDAITHVTVENPSKSLAFFVRLKVNKTGKEILPVLWEDNYFSLLPGEKREVSATYRASELGTAKPAVEVSGWNVASQ